MRWRAFLAERVYLHQADAIISPSSSFADRLAELYTLPCEKFLVIPVRR